MFWQPINVERNRGKTKKNVEGRHQKILEGWNFQRVAVNRKEWGRLRETFALK